MLDTLLINASIVTCVEDNTAQAFGAVGVQNGKITFIGYDDNLPAASVVIDCEGALLTPGLIDCHTHIIYAGDRADEWAARLSGTSYADIAKAGGGIHKTVGATRAANEAMLFELAQKRLDHMMAQGVTGIEIKSGYGLDEATELKMLQVATQLQALNPVRIQRTFLGAHCCLEQDEASTTEAVCAWMKTFHEASLIDAVDAFCEDIAFSPQSVARVFGCAQSLGLPVKCHAEQLSHSGGTQLAAQFKALSVDHIEYANAADIEAIAQSGTVAVLLPAAYYALQETQKPPIALLRQHHVPIAVATDCNPGSAPCHSLLLAMNMACNLWGLTPDEAFLGATRHAANALGWDDMGTIAIGQTANLVVWDAPHIAHLIYHMGHQPAIHVMHAGVLHHA